MHDFYTLQHLMHFCKYVEENYYSLTGQKNPFRGPPIWSFIYMQNLTSI
jgi:hypothetical protein